jgi:hypothetical protein
MKKERKERGREGEWEFALVKETKIKAGNPD